MMRRVRELFACGAALLLLAGTSISALESICATPDAIFCEDFESPGWTANWPEMFPDRQTRETNPQFVFNGSASLKMAFPPGDMNGGGWLHHWWTPVAGQGAVYVRWYVFFSQGFNWGGRDVKMAGLSGHLPGVFYHQSGVVPDGTWFSNTVLAFGVPTNGAAPREPILYTYHPNQPSQWGDNLLQNQNLPAARFEPGRWTCVETMIKPNDPPSANGEMRLWMDNVLKAQYTGMTFRTRSDVEINDLFVQAWVGEPQHTATQYRWEDNYVVARRRIGCLGAPTNPPLPPLNLRIIR